MLIQRYVSVLINKNFMFKLKLSIKMFEFVQAYDLF